MAEIAAAEPSALVSALAPFLSRRAATEIVQSARLTLSDRVESLNKEVAEIAQLFSPSANVAGVRTSCDGSVEEVESEEDVDLFA